ncbi:hypothetical protein [Streptomyces sp. NPDC017529]|uniref:hypothetical protein n=1 Tax=Streptomyces sp. NPDC017529 TaxID=3365000 RepID=UPI0037AF277A
MTTEKRLPPVVTFQSGAELLMELGIRDRITHQGVRHIADTYEDWPFGEDRSHPYGKVSNARVMATEPFLEFFRTHPSAGRGPGRRRGDV